MRQNYSRKSHRAERSGGNFKNGDGGDQQRHHSGKRTFGEVSLQPLEVAAAIHHFVDSRLKKKNREKRGDKSLKKVPCRFGCVQIWHPVTLARVRRKLKTGNAIMGLPFLTI